MIKESLEVPLEKQYAQEILNEVRKIIPAQENLEICVGFHDDGDFSLDDIQERINSDEEIYAIRLSYFMSDYDYYRYNIAVDIYKDIETGKISVEYILSELEHFGSEFGFDAPDEAVNKAISIFKDKRDKK